MDDATMPQNEIKQSNVDLYIPELNNLMHCASGLFVAVRCRCRVASSEWMCVCVWTNERFEWPNNNKTVIYYAAMWFLLLLSYYSGPFVCPVFLFHLTAVHSCDSRCSSASEVSDFRSFSPLSTLRLQSCNRDFVYAPLRLHSSRARYDHFFIVLHINSIVAKHIHTHTRWHANNMRHWTMLSKRHKINQ